MIKTNKIEPSKLKDLLSEDNPSFSGILTGESSGDIWVDNIISPSIAVVYSYSVEGYAIMGNSTDENILKNLYNFLINDLLPQFKDVWDFNFSIESDDVKEKLFEMFSSRKVGSEAEYYFRSNLKIENSTILPDDYRVIPVDKQLLLKLETGEVTNKEMLTERILGSWKSYDDFLNKSIAYTVIYNNKIVAVIVGTSNYNNIIPIDIETDENHRKKGLASVLTENFINKCNEKNIIAQWNCIESNIASRKTAEKAGFKLLKKDYFHWFE